MNLVPYTLFVILLTTSSLAAAFDFDLPWFNVPANLDISWRSQIESHEDNLNQNEEDDFYADLRNWINLTLQFDRFRFAAQFDSIAFVNAPLVKPSYLNRLALEKISASYQTKTIQVDLGDFYVSFGRAMALHVRKIDLLGEDNTLLGARFSWRQAGWRLTALSGLSNSSNVDLYEKTTQDPNDLISGARLVTPVASGVRLAVHGVHVWYDPFKTNDQASSLPVHTGILGVSCDAPGLADSFDIYAEFDVMRNWKSLNGIRASQDGYAGYVSLGTYFDNWTITLEGKSYSDYVAIARTSKNNKYPSDLIHYINPPTLESESMEVTNNYNVSGTRLQLDYRPLAGNTLLLLSYALFAAEDYNQQTRWIYNASLGLEQSFLKTGRAKLVLGLREEHPDYAMGIHIHLMYLETLFEIPLGANHGFKVQGFHWLVHELIGMPLDYVKGDWTLSFNWLPGLLVSGIIGYDTHPSAKDGGSLTSIFHDANGPYQQIFVAASLTINLQSRILLRFLAGSIRGGLMCIDGICKRTPPFSGVQSELTIRF